MNIEMNTLELSQLNNFYLMLFNVHEQSFKPDQDLGDSSSG